MYLLGMTTGKNKKYDIMEEQIKPLISSMVVVKYCSK
jgi:hypothetical protein